MSVDNFSGTRTGEVREGRGLRAGHVSKLC